jgi:hypothetical protein
MDITTDLFFCQHTDKASLRTLVQRASETDAKGLMILACSDENWTPGRIDPILQDFPNIPIFGGVFPYIVYRGKHYSNGILVVGLNVLPQITVIRHISAANNAIKKQINLLSKSITQAKSIVTFVDGLADNIEPFLEELCTFIGKGVKVAGGGAGFLDLGRRPCVFTNAGMFEDAAILVALDAPIALATGHGWEIMKGPFLVTESKGNVLASLNYASAFSVYQEQVEANSGARCGAASFATMAMTYPLGIENLDGEILVREPIQLREDRMVCVGDIHENSVVYLLKGDPDNLVAAAGDTARSLSVLQKPDSNGPVLLFDCISRALFLGADFSRELENIGNNLFRKDAFFGALTIGEICSNPNGQVKFLNKSTVLAAF